MNCEQLNLKLCLKCWFTCAQKRAKWGIAGQIGGIRWLKSGTRGGFRVLRICTPRILYGTRLWLSASDPQPGKDLVPCYRLSTVSSWKIRAAVFLLQGQKHQLGFSDDTANDSVASGSSEPSWTCPSMISIMYTGAESGFRCNFNAKLEGVEVL